MNRTLDLLLKDMERFGEINKTDIPILIKLVRDLEASERLAWLQLEQLEKQMETFWWCTQEKTKQIYSEWKHFWQGLNLKQQLAWNSPVEDRLIQSSSRSMGWGEVKFRFITNSFKSIMLNCQEYLNRRTCVYK